MPGKLSFDDLDLREEPGRESPRPTFGTSQCTTTNVCSDNTCVCTGTRYC